MIKKKKILSVVAVLVKEIQFPDCGERNCITLGDVFYGPANEMCFSNLTAGILVLSKVQSYV